MEDKINVRFRLVSIENEVNKQDFNRVTPGDIEEQALKFQFKIETVIKMSKDIIVVIPSMRYLYNNKVIIESSAEFVYAIKTLAVAIDVDKENNEIIVKSNILPSLLGAAYNTLRGMIFVRIQDTPLAKFPAPLVETEILLSKSGISVID